MMLTLYLASLIRGITAMHDLIDNKAARMAVEREQVRAGAAGIWLAY